jgi:alpha-beta hydrolase superfamily lysophospholipase
LISGEDDVVGDYGKGILACEKKLKENGADVTTKLYPKYRHEILNDSSFDMTVNDILEFIR